MIKINKRFYSLLVLLVLFTGFSGILRAQMPVTIAPQLIPPYSLQLSSYYQGASPRLIVTLLNNDLNRPGLQVKLQMSIRGRSSGVDIRTAASAATNTFVLQSGVPVQLNLTDLMTLFNVNNLTFNGGITAMAYQQKGVLPEDIYDFCFEAFEAVTGEKLSHKGCATAYITFSEPPLLNSPQKAASVKITEPANFVFSWTPRHRPNAAEPTEYTFQIVEINNSNQGGQTNTLITNPEAAFTQQKILYEEKTSSTSIVYGPAYPMLIPGKMYAWRVKADNMSTSEDRSIFRNGGYSENYYFSAVPNCATINQIVSNTQPGTFSLSWTPVPGINTYAVSYRKKGSNLPWIVQNTNEPAFSVHMLDAGVQYEYMVSFMCNNYPVTSEIGTITIAKPMAIAGAVTWKFTKPAYDNVQYEPETSNGTVTHNGEENTVWAVEESSELKGQATSVGTTGIVKLYFIIDGNTIDSIVTRTDEQGKYKAEFPPSVINHAQFLTGEKKLSIAAHIPGHTKMETKTLDVHSLNGGDLDGSITLGLNTLSLHIVGPEAGSDLSNEVEVYLQKAYYEEHLSFLNNKLSGTSIQYNGVEFVLMAKGKESTLTFSQLPKLKTQQYLLRPKYGPNISYELIDDNYNGQTAMTWWMQNTDSRIAIEQIVSPQESVLLTGTVHYNGVAKDQKTVTLSLKKGNDILTQASAITNAEGKYEVKIPTIKESGLRYEVMVRDAESRLNNINAPSVTLDITSAKDGKLVQDFDFDFGKRTITGIVLDQNGQPLSNVLVKARGPKDGTVYADVKTNRYGFYSFDLPGKTERLEIHFETEFTDQVKQTLTFKPTTKAMDAAEWSKNVLALSRVKSHAAYQLAATDPKVIGLEGNSYDEAYKYLTGTTYVITGAAEARAVTLERMKGEAQFKFAFKSGKGKAKIEFPNNIGSVSGSHNEVVKILVPFREYKLHVSAADNSTPLVPFDITRSFNITDTGVTIINIDDYKTVSGVVTNTEKKALKDVELYIEGINQKVTTDKNGAYSLVVERNEEYTIHAVLKKHQPFNKSILVEDNAVLNITLEENSIPEIKTLAGFDFTLTDIKQSNINPDVYIISGSLVPPDNDVFAAANENNTLTFDNQSVEVDSLGNASPTMDLRFNETVYSLQAFGFATVELSDEAGIYIAQLQDENGEDTRAIGGITGADLTLKLAGESNISKTGLTLSDAKIRNSRHKQVEGLEKEIPEVVFVPENHKINSLQEDETFNVTLEGSDSDSLLITKLGNLVPTTIIKHSGTLTQDGLSFEGGIGFPEVAGMKLMDESKGYLKVNRFTFKDDYNLEEIEVDVDEHTPELAIQKIRAKLQTVSLYGLSSSNFGIGIGGYVYTKKPEGGGSADTLSIKEFKFILKDKKPSVAAAFRIGGDGIGVKGLSFNQDPSQEISMDYDGQNKSFLFKASGKINYKSKDKDKGDAQSKFSATLFPVEINRFEFGTKDWSFLLMASPNAKVSLGVASIKLSKLLVSIGGTGVSISDMKSFLASEDVTVDDDDNEDDDDNKIANDEGEESDSGDEEQESNDAFAMVDEAEAAWAVGLKGGLEFSFPGEKDDKSSAASKGDAKGMSAGISASLLVAYIDDKVQIHIDSIKLKLEKPGLEVEGFVALSITEEKTGFAGGVKLVVMETGFDASFKFYSLKDLKTGETGIELGATFKAFLGPSGLPTGPITWYGIGGGFSFNTIEQKFSVFVEGDFGASGTPKESMYIKEARVSILFDAKNCGIKPVLTIAATLNIKSDDWLSITATADFCRALILVTLDGQVPIIPKTELKVAGVLLAFADIDEPTNSAAFLAVNAKIDVLDGLLKGNAFVGLGINLNKDHGLFADSLKSKWWHLIDKGALDNGGSRFHGINLNAGLNAGTSGGFNVSFMGINALNVDYSLTLAAKANIFYKFADNTLLLALSGDVDAHANVTIMGIWVKGKADLGFNLTGGYTGGAAGYWYVKGDAHVKLSLYNSNTYKCGEWAVLTNKKCTTLPDFGICYKEEKVKKEKSFWESFTSWVTSKIPVPCITGYSESCISLPGAPKFNLCVDKSVAFDYKQGAPFKYSLK